LQTALRADCSLKELRKRFAANYFGVERFRLGKSNPSGTKSVERGREVIRFVW